MILLEHIAETGGIVLAALVVFAAAANRIDRWRERRRKRKEVKPPPH